MRDYLLYYLPLISIGIGAVALAFLLAAFWLVMVRGGWQKAMQSDSQGRWSMARKLMAAGAGLGVLFGIVTMIFLALGGFRG
jgi:hypothetical protein